MIRFVKLITGEDVIADITHDADRDVYQLKNPLRFMPTRDGVALAPLVFFVKNNEITIKGSTVLFVADPDDEIVNAYNEKFGGIVVPTTSFKIVQ